MNSKRRLSIIIFIVCVVAVLEGLGWVTYQALSLEKREAQARADAQFQQTIRLALWRIDSKLAPLIAREAARPYFQYRAFYPAERAYTRMWEEVLPGEVLVPSPLLTLEDPLVTLHFELSDEGLSSPQAPTGNMRDQAEAAYVSSEQIIRAEDRLAQLKIVVYEQGLDATTATATSEYRFFEPPADGRVAAGLLMDDAVANVPAQESQALGEVLDDEFMARQQAADLSRNQSNMKQRRADAYASGAAAADKDKLEKSSPQAPRPTVDLAFGDRINLPPGADPVIHDAFIPLWRSIEGNESPALLFVRSVNAAGYEHTQGIWLDWPQLQDWLLESVKDRFPDATINPVVPGPGGAAAAPRSQLLAGIPAVFDPGFIPTIDAVGMSPTRMTIIVTWIAVLTAIAAIGLVLRASVRLSERRGNFVSAVTHELRTPLTTFCLYSQMLADGMVKDESKRAGYLETLKDESQRLARIVENVLDYARLGRKKPEAAQGSTTPAADLLARLNPTLAARATECDMRLVSTTDPSLDDALVAAEPQTVERILLNLVDNACKYAADADDKRLHLDATLRRGRVEILFADHGPGIPRAEENNIFGAFHRAKRDHNSANPGLGLGLALAKGLAREMGGDLKLVHKRNHGAEFALTLPTT